MPIQKRKSFLVNLTGSETNGCGLVRLTMQEHLRTQPVSRYAAGRSEAYDAELLVLAWRTSDTRW